MLLLIFAYGDMCSSIYAISTLRTAEMKTFERSEETELLTYPCTIMSAACKTG